ncbi:MAG: molybdate ABC transporter substrate-binding protein [Rhodospirillaceae bacterium]|nr:MAG: molybdate ABC transporter substrate-binding protein [Rhodospirillaceae bacterium]
MVYNGMRYHPLYVVALLLSSGRVAVAEPLTVYAPASIAGIVKTIEYNWLVKPGPGIRFITGSSGALARQIEYGAPAHVFISANTDWVEYLQSRKLINRHSRTAFMENVLIVITGERARDEFLAERPKSLQDVFRNFDRLALGDPRHVPAGIYAKQALKKLRLWKTVQKRIARASDVRKAFLMVERGVADLGIVYRTDVGKRGTVATVAEIPAALHEPIRYVAAGTNRKHSDTARFLDYLISPGTRRFLVDAGFVVPE